MSLRKSFWRTYRRLTRRLTGVPDTGAVKFGDLRTLEPIGRHFGEDRGRALDRYYIEAFLAAHATDVGGHALEIGEDRYTRQFGGDRVSGRDILHVRPDNPRATIIADLADAPHIPDASFDTLIITQTLHLIYDPVAGVRTMHRILRPGGVVLLTVPGITPIPNGTQWAYTWYWSLTEHSVRRMFSDAFGGSSVTVTTYGNVMAATSMLHGLSSDDLTTAEMDHVDPDFPVIIAARAVRGGGQGTSR